MIENKNKKRANRGEFLQGGEPPLIGRARSSQKTSFLFVFVFSNHSCYFFLTYPPLYDLYFVGNEFIFFEPHPHIYFFNLQAYIF